MSNTQTNQADREWILLKPFTFKMFFDNMRKELENTGSVRHILVVELSIGDCLVVKPLYLPTDSTLMYETMKEIGKELRSGCDGVESALLGFETTMVDGLKTLDAANYPSSHNPCHSEAVVLIGRSADKTRSAVVVQKFNRDEHNAPVWSDTQVTTSGAGKEGVVAEHLLDALFDD